PVSPSLRPHGRAAPAYSVAVSPPRPASRLSLHDALPILLQPFIGCVVAAFLPQNARRAEAWLAATVAVAGFVVAALFYPAAAAGEVLHFRLAWLPQFGLEFVLRMDGFAWMFTTLVTGIGFLVVLYARYYMSPAD